MASQTTQHLARTIQSAIGVSPASIQGADEDLEASLRSLGLTITRQRTDRGQPAIVFESLETLPLALRSLVAVGAPSAIFSVIADRGANSDPLAPLRSRVETLFIEHGYIKHPSSMAVFDYASL